MKIAVNTRFLIKNRLEGIGWFTYETLKRITSNHPEHSFIFFFDRAYPKEFIFSNNVTPEILFPSARHPFLWYYWFERAIPRAIKKHQPDLFISTDGYLSLSASTKTLLVMHDLSFEHYPNDVPFTARKYYKYFSKRYAKKANRLVTVSEYTKNDIIKTYGIAEDKIDIVYNGVNEVFKPLNQADKQNIKDRYTRGADYFIYVGSLHPRKNILSLLKAFEQYKRTSQSDIKLVIVGRKAWKNSDMLGFYNSMKHKQDVIFTGHLLMEELCLVLGTALALVYISYFEGFGIPLLEAMYCDVPIITSNVTSMPEVAGKAALLVDPFSIDEITAAMKKIAEDETLRKKLIMEGIKQREKFSWDKSAARLWQSIEKMLYK